MTEEEKPQPVLPGKDIAHRFVDFLWDRVHVSSGAFVLILISFIFTAAVYKIDHNSISRFDKFQTGVCSVIVQSNKGQAATRVRLQSSIDRFERQAKDEKHIADVWRYARSKQPKGTPRSQRQVVNKLIAAQQSLSDVDTQAAADLQHQLKAVAPIEIPGC